MKWGGLYILKEKIPIEVHDVIEWGQWFETADKHVALSNIGDVRISTVFLGIMHLEGFLFETMIFGGEHDYYQRRYLTWDEAEEGHQEAVDMVLDSLNEEIAVDKITESLLKEFNDPKV